jgi:hypothetical protein
MNTCTKLLVIDALRTALSSKVDENDSRVSAILAPWCDLARDTKCAVLVIHHFGKGRGEERSGVLLDRLRGSSAIGASARVVIAAYRPRAEPLGQGRTMKLQAIKSNLAELPPPLGFAVGAGGVDWCEPPEEPETPRRERAGDRAAGFLVAFLANGPRPFCEIDAVRPASVSKNGLYDARKVLGIVDLPNPDEYRKPLWALPTGSKPD